MLSHCKQALIVFTENAKCLWFIFTNTLFELEKELEKSPVFLSAWDKSVKISGSFNFDYLTLWSPESNITAWPFTALTAKVKRQAAGLDIVALTERKTDSERGESDRFKMNPLYNIKQWTFSTNRTYAFIF